MACRPAVSLFLAVVCLSAASARAQDAPSVDPPAHISLVDGSAVLERDGQVDREPASMPLLAGDRLRTEAGRVEVLFADGSALHLDSGTVVDFQSDEVVRLLEGRVRLSIAGQGRAVAYRVDAPSAWVQINQPGEYRIAILRNADVELAVLRGAAELVNEAGRSYIRAGERTFAREGSAPTPPYVFNSAAWDAFDRWSESLRDRRLGVSAQYLPNDVRPYASAFDHYGSWRHEAAYGYVWYPRVRVGWRPYHHGRWASLRPYGWTWIASDPWGWPTHHYGRWGFSAGAWFWIPGRHWGPAWVSWAYASDYVSWCPLGWNNRPVFQILNVNYYGGRRYSAWDAWTVIPRRHFDAGYVNVGRVASVRIDQRIHNTFVVRDAAPATGYAIGRSSPIRSAGRYAVPRSGGGAFSSGAATAGQVTATEPSGDRRLPSPARASRAPSSPEMQRGMQGVRGDRAISRERAGTIQDRTESPAPGGVTTATPPADGREYRRGAEGGIPRQQDDEGGRAVTAAPSGAVRAIPRGRQPADAGGDPRNGTSPYRASPYRSPSSAAPPADEAPAYRSPGYRRAPSDAGEYRGRAVPREQPAAAAPAYPSAPREGAPPPAYRSAPREAAPREAAPREAAPPAAPAYRSAPERRGPSGPPPGASAPAERSSGGRERSSGGRERSAEGGDSRSRSGDGQSTGQAVRRRR